MPNSLPSFSDPLRQRLSQLIYRCLEDLGSTKAALYLLDSGTSRFHLASQYGWPRTQPPPDRIAPLDPLLVLVSREKRAFAVNEAGAYPELKAWGLDLAQPKFFVSPIYDRGDWQGLLIQRDRFKGEPYDQEHHAIATQTICQEIVKALGICRAGFASGPLPLPQGPALDPHPLGDVPAMRVAAPPFEAMVQPSLPLPAAPRREEVLLTDEDAASVTAVPLPPPPPDGSLLDREDPFRDVPTAEVEAFIPEQQTFFWEAANLICQMVPTSAVALWLDDTVEARPLLVYSGFPLSNDLKHQLIDQTVAQVPRLKREEMRLLAKAKWAEREVIVGHFATLLPVLMEEEVGGDNLLMLFRLEDRPFSEHEQGLVRQVARMLGFYLQEVRLHERYHQAFLSVSHRILSSAEGRIPAMKTHSVNTAELSRDLARKMDLSTADVEAVSISAILHDVGTLLLDYRVLDKPRLSAEEIAKVRTHPLLAATFLKDLYFPFDVLHIIRHHHEHWDGSGYPDGLRGELIPIGSRIIHVVEAFEMMISETPYRSAKTVPQALEEMQRLAGTQFDPILVTRLVQVLKARH